jgi:FkbM family methyltransferase
MYTFGAGCQIENLDALLGEHIGYKQDGAFIEVGAFDCYKWSNTYGLAMLGWKGLYFEPQLDMVYKCRERFSGLSNIEIVHAALSNWQGNTDLFLGGSLSTISEQARDTYLRIDWSKATGLASGKVERVRVSTLDAELAARSWPAGYDLLVIDVEGSELEVLQGYDIRAHMPTMAIVETHAEVEDGTLSYKAKFIDEYFEEFGYIRIQQDDINSIYVKE